MNKKALLAFAALAVAGFAALSFDTSCANPAQLCRGTSINRRFVPNTTQPDGKCTRCVEATCCDLVGDCQTGECANQVAGAHACVLDAGRSAPGEEPKCRERELRDDQSKNVYQCMRDNCDDECGLPTCRLEPIVPPLGDPPCDQCFAKGCCALMNECAKNRTCLIALSCIVNECREQFSAELSAAAAQAATARKNLICDGGVPPVDAGPGGPGFDGTGGGCFRQCIEKAFVREDRESFEASCLAAQINECGAAVDCGKVCGVKRDAAGNEDASPAPSDAGADAADDAPSDAGAD